MSRATSWRLALRLARRDALRNRGRSILVLVMIALPVLAVTAADVVLATQDVDQVEALDRQLGSAAALVQVPAGGAPVLQGADPDHSAWEEDDQAVPPTAEQVAAALGGARLLEMHRGGVDVRTDDGVGYAEATEVDLRDPLVRGLFELTSGRWPANADEVVVGQGLLDQGYAVGDVLEVAGDGAPAPRIVGVAESSDSRTYPFAAGPVGSLALDPDAWGGPGWLAEGGPVSWEAVKKVNELGGTVLSRAVTTDPPPDSEIPEEVGESSGSDQAAVAVVVLIVVMALLELVLLAGPAFAVTARRQSRTLALMAATGGTPAQSRRVIVGGGLVLGATAALAGVVLGVGVAGALLPLLQNHADTWFGPFDVPRLHLVGIALFGLASALLATVVPAWIASRQDVVAVLAGRRADQRPSVRSPILGLVLLGAGVAGAVYGATAKSSGEFAIAASAVLAVLGMILLVPIVVVGVARLAGRLPLSPRYAARDAARHRTRTVPAVAAVAATVAGVVALGIGATSDAAENRETYDPILPHGMGSVTSYAEDADVDWTALRAAAERELPEAELAELRGVVESAGTDLPSYNLDFGASGVENLRGNTGGSWGSSVLVGVAAIDHLPDLDATQRAVAARTLRGGGVVAFSDQGVTADEVQVTAHRWDPGSGDDTSTTTRLPAVVLPVPTGKVGPAGVLPEAVARRLGVPVGVVSLLASGRITADQQEAAEEALTAVDRNSSFYVERGYQADDETMIIQLVLAGLGGVLMLGGTLTATFLALSDARPDLATLAAVGASPRRRRTVAASYALVIGGVGAVLGAAVGFIPGIAVTYPLTYLSGDFAICSGSGSCTSSGVATGPYVDIPWLMILGVVVVLPLLTAAIVALCTRSRLPLVARLD
jgi:putative ABC transport system permease protein